MTDADTLPLVAPDRIARFRAAWRTGAEPNLSTAHLQVLAKALAADDPTLIHDCTVKPISDDPEDDREEPIEACCLLAYVGWKVEGLVTTREVHAWFNRICHEIDVALGGPGDCIYVLCPWDDWPRDVARRVALEEVRRSLAQREESQ